MCSPLPTHTQKFSFHRFFVPVWVKCYAPSTPQTQEGHLPAGCNNTRKHEGIEQNSLCYLSVCSTKNGMVCVKGSICWDKFMWMVLNRIR